jgi:hypothetical protein
MDDLELREKKTELNEYSLEWWVSEKTLGKSSGVFDMWEKKLYTKFFLSYWANEKN